MKKECENCRWWVPSDETIIFGDCRLYPLTIMPGSNSHRGVWSATYASHFCGEGEGKPDVAAH